MARRSLGAGGLLGRVGAGVALVLLTFNPSGHSYAHWALRGVSQFSALEAVPGALLLCGWVLFVRAALGSLGWLGVALASLVIAALVWLLVDAGILDAAGGRSWIALVSIGLVLGFGLCWSHLRGRPRARWTWTAWIAETARPRPARTTARRPRAGGRG